MVIIIAASTTIDLDALNALVQQYDVAPTDSERERVAAEVERLVADRARGMLQNRIRGFDVSAPETDSYVTQMVRETLENTGRSRFRRNDIVPEEFLAQMRTPGNTYGRRLWSLLPATLRGELDAATYIRSPLAMRLTEAINSLMDHRDLAEELGITGHPASESAIQRSRDNASLLSSLFTSISPATAKPPHFLGYLGEFALPRVVARVVQGQGKISPSDIRSWHELLPVIKSLQGASSQIPNPEEIHAELRRRSAAEYGETIRQIEEKIRSVQPENAFKIKDYRAYGDARTILVESGVPKSEFMEGGRFYVPKSALKMPGLPTIKRLMETMGQGNSHQPIVPVEHLPAAPSQGEQGVVDVPSWALEVGQQQERGRDLYLAIVHSLYPDAESAERQIGELLAENATPETIDSYIRTLAKQDPDLADYLRTSWHTIARQIDSRVTEALSDPSIVGPIAREFGYSPSEVNAQRDKVRRTIFARNIQRIRRLGI